MADVFFAYAREYHDLANRIATALWGRGVSAWIDDGEDADEPWPAQFSRELRRARCVLALWSDEAAASRLVVSEAREAFQSRRLVNIGVADYVDAPAEFAEAPSLRLDEDEIDEDWLDLLVTRVTETMEAGDRFADEIDGEDEISVDEADELASKLVDDAYDDPTASWTPNFSDRNDMFAARSREGFDSAARSLARASDPRWRAALVQLADPHTRLAGVYAIEDLAARREDGSAWRRVLGAIAFPYYPWRALAAYARTGATESELDALVAPNQFDELRDLRVGYHGADDDDDAIAPVNVAPFATAAAGAGSAETANAAAAAAAPQPAARSGFWGFVFLVAAFITALLFVPDLMRTRDSDDQVAALTGSETPSTADSAENGTLRLNGADDPDSNGAGTDEASQADPVETEMDAEDAERLAALALAQEEAEAEAEAARLAEDAARAEEARLEAERLEAERLAEEARIAEELRLAEEARLEAERVAAERAEAERLEAERLEAERLEAERLEAERLAAEQAAEEARLAEAARLEAERAEAERLAAERLAAERAEAERLAAEEAERLAAEEAENARRLAMNEAAADENDSGSATGADAAAVSVASASSRAASAAAEERRREEERAAAIERARAARRRHGVPIADDLQATCSMAAPAEHVVEDGDTLWLIARLYYGWSCGGVFPVIYRCNEEVFAANDTGPLRARDEDTIYPGDRLYIPAYPGTDASGASCPG